MDQPSVSLIVAGSPLMDELASSLSSIQVQSFKNFECIIASSPENHESVSKLLKNNQLDERFRICVSLSDDNAALLNCGVEASRAALIAFVGAGDLLAPSCLQAVLNAFDELNPLYVLMNVKSFGASQTLIEAPDSRTTVLAAPWFPLAMFCKSDALAAIGKFEQASLSLNLSDLTLRLMQSGARGTRLDTPLYLYRHGALQPLNHTRDLEQFITSNEDAYRQNWKEILLEKDNRILALTDELAPKFEQVKRELQTLQTQHYELLQKHEELEAHHARALNSIKVTGRHLLRAIFSRFQCTVK